MLEPEGHAAVARFKDIVIQDGSSFALKKTLQHVFSGRITNREAAAVEIHATYRGLSDEVSEVSIASDSEAERQFLPAPWTLKGRLLLADRGYPSTKYFDAVRDCGGSFIVRLSRSHDPWVSAAWVQCWLAARPYPPDGWRCVLVTSSTNSRRRSFESF